MATGFYLLDNENPNAPRRSDGRRGWFYPGRRGRARIISLHTGEIAQDVDGTDLSAERIARYFTRSTRPASYHEVVDSDSVVELLPHGYTAFSVVGWNSVQWSLSFATRTVDWSGDSRDAAMLRRGAVRVAARCVQLGIPPVERSKREVEGGAWGLVRHSTMDPGRRSDPGDKFPMSTFLSLVRREIERLQGAEEMVMHGQLVQVPFEAGKPDRIYKVSGAQRVWLRSGATVEWLRKHDMVLDVVQMPKTVLLQAFPVEVG